MRVNNPKTERLEQPEACDQCDWETSNLERIVSHGPGHQVAWLCPYCTSIEKRTSQKYAPLFNLLEERIIQTLNNK